MAPHADADLGIGLPLLSAHATKIKPAGTKRTVATNMGDVTIASSHPLVDASTILVVEGNVDYRVPGNSSGLFDVEVIEGNIEIWVPEGRWRYVSQNPRDDTMSAQLNDGDNPILLRASEGDVRIAVVPDPTSYGPIR